MNMQEIQITEDMLVVNNKEKLKALKKYEVSDEFAGIKKYCEDRVEEIAEEIEEALSKRRTKKKPQELFYSDIDFMMMDREFWEEIVGMSSDKTFNEEVKDNLDALRSNVYLRIDNSDVPVYTELDGIKRRYKLHMSIEHNIKRFITKYELQDVGLENSFNAYDTKPTNGQLENIEA